MIIGTGPASRTLTASLQSLDRSEVSTLISELKGGSDDAFTALLEAFDPVLKDHARYIKGALRASSRATFDEAYTDMKLAFWETIEKYKNDNVEEEDFVDFASRELLDLRKKYIQEQKKKYGVQTFSEVEGRISYMTGNGSVSLDSLHADPRAPDPTYIDDENGEEYLEPATIEESASSVDPKDHFQDHWLYHLGGGPITRREMRLFDLANGFTGTSMNNEELASLFGVGELRIQSLLSRIRVALRTYQEPLLAQKIPQGLSFTKGDPFYHDLVKKDRSFREKDFAYVDLIYPLLSSEDQQGLDFLRGFSREHSIPPSSSELQKEWGGDCVKVLNRRKQLATRTLNLINFVKANEELKDENCQDWLFKPSEIQAMFEELDQDLLTPRDLLSRILRKIGYKSTVGDKTLNAKCSDSKIRELVDKKLSFKPLERRVAVPVLVSIIRQKPDSPWGRLFRKCPKLFHGLLINISGKRISVLNSARKAEEKGELTYYRLARIFMGYGFKKPTYNTLHNFAEEFGSEVIHVHSNLYEPRVSKRVVKRARELEARDCLTTDQLRQIIEEESEHKYASMQPIMKFAHLKRLRLKLTGREGVSIEGYITPDKIDDIVVAARELQERDELTFASLNDIVEQITGHRYVHSYNPALDQFARDHKLVVTLRDEDMPPTALLKAKADPGDSSVRERVDMIKKHFIADILIEARPWERRRLLTPKRLNRIIHDVSGICFIKTETVERFADKNKLKLQPDPEVILDDIDRGMTAMEALRELCAELKLPQQLVSFTQHQADIDYVKAIGELIQDGNPSIDGLTEGNIQGTKVKLLNEALQADKESKVGRKLRETENYKRFIANLIALGV